VGGAGGGGVGGLVTVMKESGGMYVKGCDQLDARCGSRGLILTLMTVFCLFIRG
jgi:hypothetical protein